MLKKYITEGYEDWKEIFGLRGICVPPFQQFFHPRNSIFSKPWAGRSNSERSISTTEKHLGLPNNSSTPTESNLTWDNDMEGWPLSRIIWPKGKHRTKNGRNFPSWIKSSLFEDHFNREIETSYFLGDMRLQTIQPEVRKPTFQTRSTSSIFQKHSTGLTVWSSSRKRESIVGS